MAGGPIRRMISKVLRSRFIATAEESFQQRQRTPRSFDQGGFGHCPDLRVFGRQAICPVRRGLSECWYGQNTEQRADEQVSHGSGRDPLIHLTDSWALACRRASTEGGSE